MKQHDNWVELCDLNEFPELGLELHGQDEGLGLTGWSERLELEKTGQQQVIALRDRDEMQHVWRQFW